MTAQCVAAGLYPILRQNAFLNKDKTYPWNLGSWQPIPVQTVPYEKDMVCLNLFPISMYCIYDLCESMNSMDEKLIFFPMEERMKEPPMIPM